MNFKDDLNQTLNCYIENFKFENYMKTQEEFNKMSDMDKTKYLDDLKIIKSVVKMVKTKRDFQNEF
jgi:hypothetical protein